MHALPHGLGLDAVQEGGEAVEQLRVLGEVVEMLEVRGQNIKESDSGGHVSSEEVICQVSR